VGLHIHCTLAVFHLSTRLLLLLFLQFITSAQPSSISSTKLRRCKASAPSVDTPAAAAPSAVPGAAIHSLPAQLQQRWHETVLPTVLQHLLTCYSLLIGSASSSPSSTGSTSSAAHGSTTYSQGAQDSHAMPGQQQLPGLGTCGCLMPALTPKQQASVDQVRW
jgi:hypothetical protein